MAEVNIPKSSLDQGGIKEQNKREKLDPVVSSGTKNKKKTTWDKIRDEFISEDGKTVGDYLLLDVLIPAIKNTIQAMVNNGVDMILYGNRMSNRNGYSNGYAGNRVSYRQYYDQRNQSSYYSRPRNTYGYDYNEIVFESRADAEAVLYRMIETLNTYQIVRVADYLELSGRDSNYTDNNYGWTSLDSVQIRRARDGGFFLDLPRPMAID